MRVMICVESALIYVPEEFKENIQEIYHYLLIENGLDLALMTVIYEDRETLKVVDEDTNNTIFEVEKDFLREEIKRIGERYGERIHF